MRAPAIAVLEHLHHEVRAQVVHHHQVEPVTHHIVGRDRRLAALAGQNFFDNIHSWCQPSGPGCRYRRSKRRFSPRLIITCIEVITFAESSCGCNRSQG